MEIEAETRKTLDQQGLKTNVASETGRRSFFPTLASRPGKRRKGFVP
jgi:hypothetical protein